jgi:hypothetical protein
MGSVKIYLSDGKIHHFYVTFDYTSSRNTSQGLGICHAKQESVTCAIYPRHTVVGINFPPTSLKSAYLLRSQWAPHCFQS